MIDQIYTYKYNGSESKKKKGYVVDMEVTNDFEVNEVLEVIMDSIKINNDVQDKIQFNLRIFEIQDPGFKKGMFNDVDVWEYLFKIPELRQDAHGD